MKRVDRFAEYDGWKIEASPTRLIKQRLIASGVIVSRDGERFIFTDLGNRVYRWQAYERGVEWAKRWIDNNYGLGASQVPHE
jgi:sugar lactone lactonase YvrE